MTLFLVQPDHFLSPDQIFRDSTSSFCRYCSVQLCEYLLLQLNCETDFVARNEKFQALLAVATQATLAQKSPVVLDTTDHPSIDYLTPEVLKTVNIEGAAGTLANLVANAIGLLSENIIFTRGTTMSASKGLICSHIYNNTVNQPGALVGMGTYATLVHLLPTDSKDSFDTRLDDIRMLGSQIGQHITGTNPASVYPQEGREEGEALLAQNFVLDSSIRVADMLREKNVKVSKFVRFALGGAETSL